MRDFNNVRKLQLYGKPKLCVEIGSIWRNRRLRNLSRACRADLGMKWISILIMGLSLVSAVSGNTATSDAMVMKPGQKQLFLDDYAIDWTYRINREMHRPEKQGAVFLPEGTLDGIRVQGNSAPIWDPKEKVFKLYYVAFPWRDGNWIVDEIGPAIAVSNDGLHWRREPLDRVTIAGSSHNNRYYSGDPEIHWPENNLMNIVYNSEPNASDYPFKALVGAHTGRIPKQSANGIDWFECGADRIPSSDTSTLTYDEAMKRYIAVVKVPTEYGRSAAVAFSEDFRIWTKPKLTLQTDELDNQIALLRIRDRLADPGMQDPLFVNVEPKHIWSPKWNKIPTGVIDAGENDLRETTKHIKIPDWRAEIYRLSIFPYEGLYLGLAQMYYPVGTVRPELNNSDGFNEVQLIMSRDVELKLENWIRVGNREPFLETSRLDKGLVGNFDRLQLGPPNRPLVLGNELWFYYTGSKTRALRFNVRADGSKIESGDLAEEVKADYLDEGMIAICLAKLRLDGFVSMNAGDDEGLLVTKYFKANGAKLFLNVDVESGGSASVMVSDIHGKPLESFGFSQNIKVTGNEVKQEVEWDQSKWKELQGRQVRLNIRLKKSKLYALWTDN